MAQKKPYILLFFVLFFISLSVACYGQQQTSVAVKKQSDLDSYMTLI